MSSLETAIRIAGSVLEAARYSDPNAPIAEEAITAWGHIFDGQPIWPDEALEAVYAHYRQEVAYPIKPGEILAYCKKQPVWSSREHASWALDMWARYPYSTSIADHTGIQPPEFEVPEHIPDGEVRDWLVQQTRAWVDANRAELIDAIIRRKHKVVEA